MMRLPLKAKTAYVRFVPPADALALTFRPVTPADDGFLFRLYASTRGEEMARTDWSPAQQEVFLRMQFAARQHSYHAGFPRAEHSVIAGGHGAVGAWIVDRTQDEIRLVDLALLPGQRCRGLGRRLLQVLMAEAGAAGKPLRLQVLKTNPALRLYSRLGFTPTRDSGFHLQMEWTPAVTTAALAPCPDRVG
jgi:ribosomal protein S18 acetylase RimI-like enzyme